MPAPVIFITIPYSEIRNETEIQYEKDIGVNILIDSTDIDMPSIINFVSSIHYQFIFSLSAKVLFDRAIKSILPILYTLFTLSGSLRQNKNRMPVFLNTPQEHSDSLEFLRDYFQLQGEPHLEFAIFESGSGYQVNNSILITNRTQLSMFDPTLLEKYNGHNSDQVILLPDYTGTMKGEIILIKSLVKDNMYVRMLIEMAALRAAAHRGHYQSNLWKERSDLYYSFILLSKKVGESQYYNILDWYEKEYEILPLWYKRFGHLLKVVAGKRRFKSLFRNDVKKYYD